MRGELNPCVWTFTKIVSVSPISVILISQFRMFMHWNRESLLFTNAWNTLTSHNLSVLFAKLLFYALKNFELHCLTFVDLQIGLYLIALQNTLQMYYADIGYPFLDWMDGGAENRVRNTKRASIIYMAVLTFVNFGYLGLCGEGIAKGSHQPHTFDKYWHRFTRRDIRQILAFSQRVRCSFDRSQPVQARLPTQGCS